MVNAQTQQYHHQGTISLAMEQSPVEVRTRYSPNPNNQINYTVFCAGHSVRTVVTAKPAVVRRWVFTILHRHRFQLRRGRLVVGLGVQWAPGSAIAATLQLCVGHHCLIFQLQYAGQSPAILHRLLADPRVTFAGVWNPRDSDMLENSPHRLRLRHLVDLRKLASNMYGCRKGASMETLADAILGMPGMVKDGWVGRSEWDDEWLSEEQVKYACVDAFLAFLMAKKLTVWKWVN